jgi:c-di-AMP phosphodiesterase-like protein
VNQNFKKHLEASYTRAFEECARTGHKIGDLDAIFNSIAMGTFAELIVRECVNRVKSKADRWGTMTDEIINECVLDCAKDLREHFGVEE